jgi:hypothetical protein
MAKLCCFWCPSKNFDERSSDEECPICHRRFNAPLQQPPERIDRFVIIEPITRGFYSAVYRAQQESLGRTVVLKVVPVAVYDFFGKDWDAECREHAEIAEGTTFVARITDKFQSDVHVAGVVVPCHVAVLENIPGPTLQQVIENPAEHGLTARVAGQIAGDLFEILQLFNERNRNHNDLHAGNVMIRPLGPGQQRNGAIEPKIQAVAVDLGSVLDANRSGDHGGKAFGDQHQIAKHISALSSIVHRRRSSDVDYRVAGALRALAEHLTPATNAQRIMTVGDALKAIRTAMNTVDEPWQVALSLNRFGDAYNAQALESWHVPQLWFDPAQRWLRRTTVRGAQVITGMRGCGKTMLLRALHFHARVVSSPSIPVTSAALAQFKKDTFLGVYASCQKLLSPSNYDHNVPRAVPLAYERLYVAYLRDAVQVLRHIRFVDPSELLSSIDILLRDALSALDMGDMTQPPAGEADFAEFLMELQFSLADGKGTCRLKVAPADAFGHLAAVIRGAAPTLNDKYVLFLLDDVSTRYLHPEMVREVISSLLFQHSQCAFRITTEAQALQRFLVSPGGGAPADPNRDYDEFNLGNEVYRLLQEGSTKQSMNFVAEILRRRGRQFGDRREPLVLLGDVTLEEIAGDIAASSESSSRRKSVYRGLRAIQAACVGDLGDVVKLYEKILQRASSDQVVSAEKQTECFMEHSANLMHFLNRLDQYKKSLALAFAQAAGELLQQSALSKSKRGLRQYTKLYVRVDAGPDFEGVATKLLDLMDAGVFVYDGGGPRTKTRDDDPVLQFKLSYRKMLGLASFIGLADRDRFELSGEKLKRWLEHPEEAKAILVESESRRTTAAETPADTAASGSAIEPTEDGLVSSDPSDESGQPVFDFEPVEVPPIVLAPTLGLETSKCTLMDLATRGVELLVMARGFEERALSSARSVLDALRPKTVALVHYSEDQGKAIATLLGERSISPIVIHDLASLTSTIERASGPIVVDASGLSKPYLFVAVRDALRRMKAVSIVHTLAEQYFPRNEDLHARGIMMSGSGTAAFESLEDLLIGEAGPYRLEVVHEESAAPERSRALIASASPKNDRLLHLLDKGSYDAVRILVPPATSERRLVARHAAELAASAADSNVGMKEVDTNDILGAIAATEEIYNELYYGGAANVEIGLTGSKIHAVAFAGLAAAGRVSTAWYVSPRVFDHARFTTGVGETRCFDLRLVEVDKAHL